jgi:hypothetical protein
MKESNVPSRKHAENNTCLFMLNIANEIVVLMSYAEKVFLVPYRFTGGDFRFTLRPSVCQSVRTSVHKTGSRDNAKSAENILMKLDIWIDGSMEIMHVFFFSSYVENSG